MTAPSEPRWRPLVVLLLFLPLAFSAFYAPPRDADTYWHLAVGREMVQSSHLVTSDPFTYTARDQSWEDTEWLFHLAIYPLWRLGGEGGLVLAAALLGLLVLLQLYRLVRLAGVSAPLFLLVLIPCIPVVADRIRIRPDTVSLLFEAILLEILLRFRGPTAEPSAELPGWRKSARLSAVLTALFVPWANIHGGWSFGLMTVGLFVAGWALDAFLQDPPPLRTLAPLLLPPALSVAALFANPYGWRIPWFPFKTLSTFTDPSQIPILEWARTPLGTFQGIFLLVGFGALLHILLVKPRFPLAWVLPFAGYLAMGFLWIRFPAHTTLVVVPLALLRYRQTGLPKHVLVPAAAMLTITTMWVTGTLITSRIRLGFPTRWDLSGEYPVQETAFLVSRNLSGNLLHPYRAGGYLDFYYYPLGATFMDGRYFPFRSLLAEYNVSFSSLQEFGRFLDRYPTQIVLQPYITGQRNSPERTGLPPRGYYHYLFPRERWAPIFFGSYGGVFLRREPRWDVVIRENEYRVFSPDDIPYLAWSDPRAPRERDLLISEAQRFERESGKSPFSPEVRRLLGKHGR